MNKALSPAEQLAMMIKLAATHHMKQFDKGGRPYVLHVLKVMHYLKDKDDDELNCIAVGHDLIEDTPVQQCDLERLGISDRVIDGITRLTKIPFQSHDEYLKDILKSHDACRVKLADLRHNTDIRRLKGLRQKDLQRIQKYHKMHMQIKDMIAWYEKNHLSMFSFPGDYFDARNEQVKLIMEKEYDAN